MYKTAVTHVAIATDTSKTAKIKKGLQYGLDVYKGIMMHMGVTDILMLLPYRLLLDLPDTLSHLRNCLDHMVTVQVLWQASLCVP